VLYRVFPHVRNARPTPLDVPRDLQGSGRHDNPDDYTAVYLAREPIAAVAERIQAFRGSRLTEGAFARPDGRVLALAEVDDSDWPDLVDLDDPIVLAAEAIRPSRVATGNPAAIRRMALEFFHRGSLGLSWWSTVEASWTNVTVFRERLERPVDIIDVQVLSPTHPVVREAAAFLLIDVPIAPRRRR
jgi:RES domain-containing protein